MPASAFHCDVFAREFAQREIGNIRGAVLGGLALGLVENWGVTCVRNSWRDVIAFGILVLVLMFRPTGLLGERLGRSA